MCQGGFLQKDEIEGWDLYENLAEKTIPWEPTSESSKNPNSISSKGDLWLIFYLHTKYSISDFKIKECKLLNSTAIASGYAGRDPQVGTSDGSFFSKFSFMLPLMVKVLL